DDRSRFFSIAATNPDESALSELQRVSLGAYRAYLKHNSSSLVQATYTFGSLAGCAEKCFIMQTLATNSTFVPSRYTVKLSRMYVLGNLEREVIYIFEPKQSQPAAVLALNAGQGVSFIMLRDDEGSSYTFYDRSWTQLGTHSMNSAVQSNRPSKITYNSPSGRDTNLQPPLMGVCQHRWNMSLLKQAGFLDQLTLADYSPGQNLAYRDPRTNLFALGPDGYTWWTHQSAMLEKIVAENKSLTLLPMTETQCFSTNSFLRWAPSATHDGLRTVLVMNSQEMTREICSSKYHKALSDPNIVWVVDAGSNGERNPSRLRCPQNALANTGTGLVVAASDNHEIDRYSNFGNEYADIAAPKGGEWSVYESFAAVTVARVVAEIGRAFPELDARSLRMAILLGAHIPNAEQPLDVRAGGILDEQRSHQIAMYLETARRQNKDVTDRDTTKTVLQNVFCGSSVQECHIAAVKLKLLLDAGVIK
ncbi:MAG TPA: hypothetical protein PLH57_08710, partial [Oligoflexia bacterium]|nr:hypothetical protein [Oligoflexia bacterium]